MIPPEGIGAARRGATGDPPRIDVPDLERSLKNVRTLFSALMSVVTVTASVVALYPLFSVLYLLIVRGGRRLGLSLFTELPPGAGMIGGGIGNAIVGTLVTVGLAAVLAVPFGILAAIYLAEYGDGSRVAGVVRFSAKVLTGMPSILTGVFAYAAVVVVTGSFSAVAGAVALSILVLPIVMLTAEEAIRMVPHKMKEAAIGMGATDTQTTLRVTLPTAMPAILTGVMLSLSRAMGETAPLLFTALFSDFWFEGGLGEPIATLAVLIYNFSGSPFDNQIDLAWAASLVLVAIVLVINLAGQALTKRPERR